ncbi:MAG: hypothetical protein KJN71_05930 [Acidimicrobiia bacterium]|nr:hypothetical protein [Acidimicrobiia bacterium]NNC75147.1 hypothetical protein [Acidimicrobiia bacterium]
MRIKSSPLIETGSRTMVPTLVVVSLFLLVVGHDSPGGGFVGGLLAGSALLVVFVAAGRPAVEAILPVRSDTILGLGLATAVFTALGGMVFGSALLDAGKLTLDLGWLGKLSVGSSLLFDVGVYLIVVGLVATVILRLGGAEQESA